MNSKVALVTGSTGGIGVEIADQLAADGWDLILLNRSEEKSSAQCAELQSRHKSQTFRSYIADFLDLSKVNTALDTISSDFPEIHGIFNNAGFLSGERTTSEQGLEAHFAINALVPFVIIQSLRSNLSSGSSAERAAFVANLSSGSIDSVKKIDVSTLTNPEKVGGLMGAYANSKVVVNTMGQAMKSELESEGILILSVDPGPTQSHMVAAGDGIPWIIRILRPLLFKPASSQTAKLLSGVMKAREQGATGIYISEGKVKPEHPLALDPVIQAEVMDLLNGQLERT